MTKTILGLIFDFIGVWILLYVSERTRGCTTPADVDQIISPWIQRTGYLLIALGFLLQLVGNWDK